MSDRAGFGPDTTAEEVSESIDLAGKRAIVTGASGGIGAETARVLAKRGAAVTLAVRNVDKAEAVAAAIRKETPDAELDILELELSSPESARGFAKAWLEQHDTLHILVNNAAVMGCPLEHTPEGWELQFATNHLGHFLVTNGLKPALESGGADGGARIVCVSSGGHRASGIVYDDIHYTGGRPYDKWESYGQAKTANVLFAVELDRRWQSLGIRANALHPGAIPTELGRHLVPDDVKDMLERVPGGQLQYKTIGAGAATSVWAATAPELAEVGGRYLEDCHVAEIRSGGDSPDGVEAYAVDSDSARRLWQVSEEMLGEHFA